MKKIFSLLSVGLFLLPSLAFAAQGYEPIPEGILNTPQDLVDKIAVVGNWLFTILLVLAVIFIVFAAYKYMFSGGGEEVGAAHKMLLYAAVAIAVAFLANGIVSVVKKLVGGPAPTTTSQTGGTGGTGTGSGAGSADAIQWAPVPFVRSDNSERPFNVRVQKCSDGQTPGVVITYNGGSWGNFSSDLSIGAAEAGNPNIPGANASSSSAGSFGRAGSFSMGWLGVGGSIGLGTGYDFDVETCNDDVVPVVQVDKAKNGSWQIVN